MGSDQYHLHIETISRKPTIKYPKGRTSVRTAAYISGSNLKDYVRNRRFNFEYKLEVANDELVLPISAPDSLIHELEAAKRDKNSMRAFREKFWNMNEKNVKSLKDCSAKTMDIAYPLEFNEEQRKICRGQFVKIFTDLGYAVDSADHLKEKNKNPHFHILITPFKMDKQNTWAKYKEIKGYVCENSFGEKKVFQRSQEIEEYNKTHLDKYSRIPVIDPKTGKQKIARRNEKVWKRETIVQNPLTNKYNLRQWRKDWEVIANQFLPDDRKISCESYETLGIDKIPTIHLGGKANRIKEGSYRYKQNQEIMFLNMEKESMQQTNNMSTDQLLAQVDDIDRMFHNSMLEDLGIEEKPKRKEPSIHISTGALNAIQRENEV